MNKALFEVLACPVHKTKLIHKNTESTASGMMKSGMLFCEQCGKVVASVKHGKIDFLRVDSIRKSDIMPLCDEFHYKRLPWSDKSITAINFDKVDLGWNSEGFSGCLLARETTDWSICIQTEATDIALRFLSHDWSGAVYVNVNDSICLTIDLFSDKENDVKPYEIFRNLPGQKKITITPARNNPASKGRQVYFFGVDAVFSGEAPFKGINRGNGFPLAYQWALDNLGPNALVLDCGSGDRKYFDPRVVSFEYLPFELPDVFGDGHKLPFADGSFDAVFSQAVMEHMQDPYLAAREISRITKSGGLIYVESAFMQPLHAVPYHFFNTTTWGIEAIFRDAGVSAEVSEWFGCISNSVEWYLNSCGGGGLTLSEREALRELFLKVDANVSYDQLKPMASAVSFWGIKSGIKSHWEARLKTGNRPTFKYLLPSGDIAIGSSLKGTRNIVQIKKLYRYFKSVIKRILGRR